MQVQVTVHPEVHPEEQPVLRAIDMLLAATICAASSFADTN